MRATPAILKFGSILIAFTLAACGYNVQTSSGKDYIAAIPLPSAMSPGDIEVQIRAAADIEPILRFPARVGLARVGRENGHLALLPPSAEEAKAWLDLAGDLGPEFGEFVPVSPLIAAIVSPAQTGSDRTTSLRETVNAIRLTAARQHLEAVLIYEADATADSRRNPLSIANWTIIGAFIVPSRNVKAEGVAQALLIDVRNGYPYGTIQANANDKTIAALFANEEATQDLSKRVEIAAVQNLTHEAKGLMRQLKVKLAALDKPVKAP